MTFYKLKPKPLFTLPVKYDDLSRHHSHLVREQYVREQKGLCMWCHCSLDGPPSVANQSKKIDLRLFPPCFEDHPVHLQYCHKSGLTQGAVHMKCSAIMWQHHGR